MRRRRITKGMEDKIPESRVSHKPQSSHRLSMIDTDADVDASLTATQSNCLVLCLWALETKLRCPDNCHLLLSVKGEERMTWMHVKIRGNNCI